MRPDAGWSPAPTTRRCGSGGSRARAPARWSVPCAYPSDQTPRAARLAGFYGHRWVTYAASLGGEDLFGWHVNRGPYRAPEFFGATRLSERFNRPDVIARVLETGNPEKALRHADAARRPRPAWRSRLDRRFAISATPPVPGLLLPVLHLLSHRLETTTDGTRMDCTYSARSATVPVLWVEVRLAGKSLPLLLDRRELETDRGRRVVGQLRCLVPPGDGVLSLVALSELGAGEAVLLPITPAGNNQ